MTPSPPRRRVSHAGVLRQIFPFAGLAFLFAAVGVLHVSSRVMVVDAGYRLSKLEAQQRQLSLENQKLQIELATLKSPARLEQLAREQLGMRPPPPGGVIAVRAVPAVHQARTGPAPVHPERRPQAGVEGSASLSVMTADLPSGHQVPSEPSTPLRYAQAERRSSSPSGSPTSP